MDKLKTISFSGYRPQKMPFTENSKEFSVFMDNLKNCIEENILNGFDTFIVGGATGFDLYATRVILMLKETYDIKLIIAKAYKGVQKSSSEYQEIFSIADEVINVSENYATYVYHKRNDFMIDNSSVLICFYDGKEGGTKYTVSYAKKKGLKIINLATTFNEKN